jgi:hypothetical protein
LRQQRRAFWRITALGCARDLSRAGVIEGPQGDRCIDLQCPLCGLWWNWALPRIAKVINLLRYEGA